MPSPAVGRVFICVEHDVSGVLGAKAVTTSREISIGENACSLLIKRGIGRTEQTPWT